MGVVAHEARKNRGFASGYAMNLLAAFGSPDRAVAIVEALEAVTDEAFTCIRGDEGYDHGKPKDWCELCMARAVLRDLARALEVEERTS